MPRKTFYLALVLGLALVLPGSFAKAGDFNGSTNATAKLIAAITFAENNPVDFGDFLTGNSTTAFVLDTAGGVGLPAGGDYSSLNGAQAGSITVTGEINGSVFLEVGTGAPISSTPAGLEFSDWTCDAEGGGEASCDVGTPQSLGLGGSGDIVVAIGGKVSFVGPHPLAAATYTALVPLTASYF